MDSDKELPLNEKNNYFNWDAIEVGNAQLDHSQNFFAKGDTKQEKQEFINHLEMVNKEIESFTLNDETKKKKFLEIDKENYVKALLNKPKMTFTKYGMDEENVDDESNVSPVATEAQQLPRPNTATSLNETAKPSKQPKNIAYQWSTQKRVAPKHAVKSASSTTGAYPKQAPTTPHAYDFKEVYQRKKKETLRKQIAEERKKREFHSRPVPDYSAHHERLQRRKQVHCVTVPVTPKVMKNSLEMEEKKKKKLEELQRQNQPPKFEPRPLSSHRERPFVPKRTVSEIVTCPFNLRSEERLQQRKQFDASIQQQHKIKLEQEEEERKKVEEELFKECRKQTNFKARPNPFK